MTNTDRFNYDWLATLKRGDLVVITAAMGLNSHPRVARVARVTKTQVIVTTNGQREERYRLSDGYAVGSSGYDRTYLVEATAERLAELREAANRRRAIRRWTELRDAVDSHTKDYTTAELEAIVAALVPVVQNGRLVAGMGVPDHD